VPGTLCEVDHVDGWALSQSPTDIDRLALCCGWHNRYKHTNPHQINIQKEQDGRFVYRLEAQRIRPVSTQREGRAQRLAGRCSSARQPAAVTN
jgi:hypothetical protein